jgi:PAS domain S-box-containing protein
MASDRDSAGRPTGIFARYTPQDGRFTAVMESIDLSALPGRLIERPIQVADRTWTAVIHYPAATIDASRTSGLWGILAAGFALTALVVILLHRETMRTDHAEKAVAAATAELRKSATLLRAAAEAASAGIYDHDHLINTIYWSPEQRANFGLGPDEVVTVDLFLSHVHPDDRERIEAAMRHAHDPASDGRFDVEHRIIRRDGSVRWVLARGRTFFEGDGPGRQPVRTVGAVFDVTERVRGSEERAALEMQLAQSQRMEAVGQLTGGVAHDFNNLLGVISGNLELLGEALQDRPDLHGRLQTALNATDRGATLTRSLLAFARRQPLEPRIVDANALMREMAELLQRTVQENIEIEFVGGAGIWSCEADPGQLQNALLNLVVNARDAMPGGGRITIETGNVRLDDEYAAAHADVTPGQYVMLAVSDTGSGIPPDMLTRVFEPFFTTKEAGKGTGLGLSMVYGFVKQSRGHVKIYSEVGHGTTVRIYLPRSTSANVQPDRIPAPKEAGGRGETILMVEDDPDMRTLGCALLHSLGYEVLDAQDAHEALRLLQMKTVSLLLTDVMLRGDMNGRQLAEEACRRQPGLRVLYMSGYSENAIIHHGRLDPGVHLLQKPFRKRDLAAKVRAVLDEAAPP